MSQMQPIGVDEAAPSAVPLTVQQVPTARRRRLPGLPLWLRLLLRQPEVAHRADHRLRHVRRGDLRAAARDARPDGVLAAGREAVSLLEPLLRHHRPGHRHLVTGRLGNAQLALPRRRRGHARDRARGQPRHPRRLQRRLGRRRHQLRDQRLPRDPHDPAADRGLGLPQGPRLAQHDPHPRPHAVGLRGAHPARPGPHAAESRFRHGGEGRRRADLAHRACSS